jgi:phosphate-selective porin
VTRPLHTILSALPLILSALPAAPARAQDAASADSARAEPPRWYERVSIRGYAQVRYNRLLESNERLVCTQCDRSLGANNGIFVRRMRVSIVAEPSDRVRFVLQPDFTAEAGEANGMAQVRDAYVEFGLDGRGAGRVRLGQTNVPFGFENLVSSSRRAPFDRADPLNSAAPTERDLGAYLYWTPRAARERYAALERSPGKGTGDMGVVSLGVYNGQTANRPEQNDNLHVGLRLAYPVAVGGQVVEPVLSGYTGRYVVTAAQRTAGNGADREFRDRRVAAALVLHPRPLGLQAEWNVGTGPEADPAARTIRQRRLSGGYVQAMLRVRALGRPVTPYVRAQRYDGGKKFETDARRHRVREVEAGVEWLVTPEVELTAAFMAVERETSDLATPENLQRGHRLRLQAQLAF